MRKLPKRKVSKPRPAGVSKPLVGGLVLVLLLLCLVLWVATRPARQEEASGADSAVGISNQQIARIEERQQAADSVIDYARLDRRLQALIAEDQMIGMAVGIVENGQIRFLKGYGVTTAGTTDPVGVGTLFRWASVSKGVAGDMVSKLADEGKLSVYEPIGKYSPWMRLPGGIEQRATVADMLSHSLGLAGHAYDNKLEEGADPRMLRGALSSLNLICAPGQCHAYQNVAYDGASDVVEKVTGTPYQQAVRDRLFRPLGMTSANMSRDGLVTAASWARPHVGGKHSKPVEVTEPYYRVPSAGGVNSTIKDLAIWMQAQMGLAPNVLTPRALEAVQSPRVSTPGELGRMRKFRERLKTASYGMGWRIYDYAGHKVVGHRGGVRGYRSLVMFDPALKSGVVALWNSSTNQPGGLEFEVMDMLYRLEPRDWLGVDGRETPAQPAPEAVGNGAQGAD
ncbi:serine hydrolase [Sphingosinicella sp. BN140058]|uniref:serine hydrolase domain-containing protein n=1 Tax=Sphingosinicella sp. BN140058 TaxID=1892855 RepID=UPI0010125B9B|nr:serine hydrolase domain-containing protein [Sphingosinicella sp. BN140058]QAY78839.1 class A beta-lactamase-related serine hydrolase [Sphingosinicella sp. BN140058]